MSSDLKKSGKGGSSTGNAVSDILNALAKSSGVEVPTKAVVGMEPNVRGSVAVVRNGERLLLPETMGNTEAILWLAREEVADQAVVGVSHKIHCIPTDGAVALARVLKRRFGYVDLIKTPGFFGSTPPTMFSVQTGPNPEDVVQVPWGRMQLPDIDGFLQTSAGFDDGRPCFAITGEVKRRNEDLVLAIANEVREEIRLNSIYRASAIKIDFADYNPDRDSAFDEKFAPKFMKLDGRQRVIFNADAEARLHTELYNPVMHTQICRDNGIPLKRGILLSGPYGTGKTLTAFDLAAAAVANSWTFVYVEKSETLPQALQFAALFQPCVIFVEDIDRAIKENDDPELIEARNAMDSVLTKNVEIMVVMTTNHLEVLPQGFLRCGRVDSIVEIDRPNMESVIRLVRLYSSNTVDATDAELHEALKLMNGQAAAVIRELVERAKLAAVQTTAPGEKIVVTARALEIAAQTLAQHMQLLSGVGKAIPTHPAIMSHNLMVRDVARAVGSVSRMAGEGVPVSIAQDSYTSLLASGAPMAGESGN
jgi:transitional endoplasmic reticulum ATPase